MQITNNATYNLDTVWDTILSQFPFYVVIWGYFDRLKIILKAVLGPLASALQIFGMYFGSFRCATVIWLYPYLKDLKCIYLNLEAQHYSNF